MFRPSLKAIATAASVGVLAASLAACGSSGSSSASGSATGQNAAATSGLPTVINRMCCACTRLGT